MALKIIANNVEEYRQMPEAKKQEEVLRKRYDERKIFEDEVAYFVWRNSQRAKK